MHARRESKLFGNTVSRPRVSSNSDEWGTRLVCAAGWKGLCQWKEEHQVRAASQLWVVAQLGRKVLRSPGDRVQTTDSSALCWRRCVSCNAHSADSVIIRLRAGGQRYHAVAARMERGAAWSIRAVDSTRVSGSQA